VCGHRNAKGLSTSKIELGAVTDLILRGCCDNGKTSLYYAFCKNTLTYGICYNRGYGGDHACGNLVRLGNYIKRGDSVKYYRHLDNTYCRNHMCQCELFTKTSRKSSCKTCMRKREFVVAFDNNVYKFTIHDMLVIHILERSNLIPDIKSIIISHIGMTPRLCRK
jgi:hypothetical protein